MIFCYSTYVDDAILDWTFVKLLRFSEECDKKYIEMSEEQLDIELKRHPDEGPQWLSLVLIPPL